MAKKPPEPTNEQLLDRLLNGGPRQRRDAGAALRRRACAGEQLASLMPDPGSLSDPAQRYYVLGILSLHYCKEDQFEAYVGLLRHQHLGSALLDWGNFVHTRAPQFIPGSCPW